jgi:predicted Zn-dependent peptidase
MALTAARLRQLALRFALILVLAGTGLFGRSGPPRADAQTATTTGVTMTLSATTEDAQSSYTTGLLIQIQLHNGSGTALSGLSLQSQIPANAGAQTSWTGTAGQGQGQLGSGTISWSGLQVPAGGDVGPFAYLLGPDSGQDGANVFVHASIQPRIIGLDSATSATTALVLPLNGLWGAESLRRTVLPSGLTIFTQARPDTPTVALQLADRSGSRDEDSTTCGASYWLEHGHFLGTPTKPDSQAVGRPILSVGGEFNASTGWESTQFWDLVPAASFDTAVDTLADQMLNSTYPPGPFKQEQQILIQEIKLRSDAPSVHAFDQFQKLVFQTSPLRHSPADIDCLPDMTTDTVFSFSAKHYVTGNIAIAASGNLDHESAVTKIATAFAGLPVGPREPRPAMPEPIETQPRMAESGDPAATATIRLGWPVAGEDNPDWAPTTLLADILGSVGERMAQAVRDAHAVGTNIDASYLDYSDAGALMLSATAPADQAHAVTQLLLGQVQRLRDGDLSDADVQAALTAATGARAVSTELNLDQVGRATDEVAGSIQSYDEELARLQTVKPADIQRVAQQYLDPDNYSLVVSHQ